MKKIIALFCLFFLLCLVCTEREDSEIPVATRRTTDQYVQTLSMSQLLNALLIGGRNDTTQVCNMLDLSKENFVRFCAEDTLPPRIRLLYTRSILRIDLLYGRKWLLKMQKKDSFLFSNYLKEWQSIKSKMKK